MTAATLTAAPLAPARRPRPRRRAAAHPHAGLAQPGADQAQPVGAARPEHPAGDVRAALHVRLRRRDLRQRRRRTSQFALPGIIVQNAFFATMTTGVGLNTRPHQGRLRPAAVAADRPLVPAGRPDPRRHGQAGLGGRAAARRRHDPRASGSNHGVGGLLAAFALLLVFSLAASWISVLVGVLVSEPEKVQIFGFMVIFPLTFTSNAFVPTDTMPGWLQALGRR